MNKSELEHIFLSLMYIVDENKIKVDSKLDDLQNEIMNKGVNEKEITNVINTVYNLLKDQE